jgi:hypothetical protein
MALISTCAEIAAAAIFCLSNLSAHGQSLSPIKARQICSAVESMANSGQLENRFKRFRNPTEAETAEFERAIKKFPEMGGIYLRGLLDVDYDGDGKPDRLGDLSYMATCASSYINDMRWLASTDKNAGVYLGFSNVEAGFDDALRSAGFGGSQHLMFVLNEPVIVTGRFGGNIHRRVELVSWFREGQLRPLCSFTYANASSSKLVRSNDALLCRSVIAGKVERLDWNLHAAPSREHLQRGVDSAKGMQVDLSQTGKEGILALMDYASGAGCGSNHQFLRVLDADGETPAKSPLNKLLEQHAFATTTVELPKEWEPIQILRFASKHYVLSPTAEGAEVSSYWGNRRQTWCQIDLARKFRIDKYYYPRE